MLDRPGFSHFQISGLFAFKPWKRNRIAVPDFCTGRQVQCSGGVHNVQDQRGTVGGQKGGDRYILRQILSSEIGSNPTKISVICFQTFFSSSETA